MGRGRGTLGEWPEHLQNGGSGAATATAAVLAAGKTSTASASAHEKVTTAVPNMERLGTDDEEVLTRALDGGTISSDGVLPNLGRVGAVSSDGVADSACNAAGAFTAATLASTATEAPLPPASPDMEAPLAPAPPPPPPMKASDLAAALLPAPLTAAQQSQGQQLHALHRAKQGTHKWNEMQAARDKLPAAAKRRAVLSALEGHSVLVVSGETGCGKTTQVCPHFCWPRGVPLIAPNPLPNLAGASIHPGRRHRVRPCRRRLDHLHPASSLKCYRCGDSGGR
jgi:HrpA-like RNA helicase